MKTTLQKIIKHIKEHKGFVQTNVTEKDKKEATAIAYIIIGTILFGGSGYLLFFTLEILTAPELIKHFIEAYLLLFSCFLTGIGCIIWGIYKIKKP